MRPTASHALKKVVAKRNRGGSTAGRRKAMRTPTMNRGGFLTRRRSGEATVDGDTIIMPTAAEVTARRHRSQLLKNQAKERLLLKQQIHELQAKRLRTRKGVDAKMERREIGKYITNLRKQMTVKQTADRTKADKQIEGAVYGNLVADDAENEDEDVCAHDDADTGASTASSSFMSLLTSKMKAIKRKGDSSGAGDSAAGGSKSCIFPQQQSSSHRGAELPTLAARQAEELRDLFACITD